MPKNVQDFFDKSKIDSNIPVGHSMAGGFYDLPDSKPASIPKNFVTVDDTHGRLGTREQQPYTDSDGMSGADVPPPARVGLFDTLSHEVKGHGSQNQRARFPGLISDLQEKYKDTYPGYILDQRELERRIQATKDWSQEQMGVRPKTPDEWDDVLGKLQAKPWSKDSTIDNIWNPLNAKTPRTHDVHDLLKIKEQMAPGDYQKLMDYVRKMAPGIVQDQNPLAKYLS